MSVFKYGCLHTCMNQYRIHSATTAVDIAIHIVSV